MPNKKGQSAAVVAALYVEVSIRRGLLAREVEDRVGRHLRQCLAHVDVLLALPLLQPQVQLLAVVIVP